MNEVDAVKDIAKVQLIPDLLCKHHSQQMADIWTVGVNIALRISDLLALRFSDINWDSQVLQVTETKTNKTAKIKLNSAALATLQRIQVSHPDSQYVFQSRRARNLQGQAKPISRQAVTKAFKEVGEIVGVQLGTHSMRKTRGFHLYKATGDIARVSKMLRHSSCAVTMRYIGLDQSQIDRDFEELVL